MTDSTQEKPEHSVRKPDVKFWALAGLVAAVLGFNVLERLFLDADERDISYARLVVSANEVTDPLPGDVFVYDHENEGFVESRFCVLQIFGEAEPVPVVIRASNLWGASVNETIASVSGYIGRKVTDYLRVEHAERKWQGTKLPRQQVRAPMEDACLSPVVEAVRNPNRTPFVVDAIYRVEGQNGQSEWVRFANPIMQDPDSCEGGCPEGKRLEEIVNAGALTRFKSRYLVYVQ